MPRRLAFVLIMAVAMAACKPTTNESTKKETKPSPDVEMALTPLPKEPAQAANELKRRLDQSLEVTDGFLTVYDFGTNKLTRHILPVTSSWSISCGAGFSIVFGSDVSGDRDGVGNDIKLSLSMTGLVPKATCDVAGLAVARHLREKLAAKFEG